MIHAVLDILLALYFGQYLVHVCHVAAGIFYFGLEQDAVARRLVQLDVELACEQTLERGAIKPRRTTQQGDTRRIQNEFVARPRVVDSFPTNPLGMEVLESAGPVLCRHHLGISS